MNKGPYQNPNTLTSVKAISAMSVVARSTFQADDHLSKDGCGILLRRAFRWRDVLSASDDGHDAAKISSHGAHAVCGISVSTPGPERLRTKMGMLHLSLSEAELGNLYNNQCLLRDEPRHPAKHSSSHRAICP